MGRMALGTTPPICLFEFVFSSSTLLAPPRHGSFPLFSPPSTVSLHIMVGSTAMSTCKRPGGLVYHAPVDWLDSMPARCLPLSVSARLRREDSIEMGKHSEMAADEEG